MNTEVKYLSTSKMSNMIDINDKWLREHRGTIFQEGVHFHYPNGFKDCRWNVSAMLDWIENSSNEFSGVADEIINSLCA